MSLPDYIDNTVKMQKRNLAAAFLVTTLSLGNSVNVNTGSLTVTGYAPGVFTGSINLPSTQTSPVFVERTSSQRIPRNAANYLAATIQANSNVLAIPPAPLALSGFAPSVIQATPVLAGQDLQLNKDFREEWMPAARNLLFALTGPGTQSVNVNVAPLALTGFAPTVTAGGAVSVNVIGLTLSGFAPTITQIPNTFVNVPLGQIDLTGYGPDVLVSNLLLVSTSALTLTAYAPTITQTPVPNGSANLPSVPYVSGIGPWDITIRTYG